MHHLPHVMNKLGVSSAFIFEVTAHNVPESHRVIEAVIRNIIFGLPLTEVGIEVGGKVYQSVCSARVNVRYKIRILL